MSEQSTETDEKLIERVPFDIAALIAHYKQECMRHLYPACSTRRCMVRGGYKTPDQPAFGKVDYSMATCEAHETIQALEALVQCRRDLEAVDAALVAMADGSEVVHVKANIVQPFLSIYKEHGETIDAARARREGAGS